MTQRAFAFSPAVAAQRSEPADSLDFFPTPPWATRAFVQHVALPILGARLGDTVLEPACGEGHMAEPLAETFGNVAASDIHPYGYGAVLDFLLDAPTGFAPADWIITNPPFNRAVEFAWTALGMAGCGVSLLVRTQWLHCDERYQLFSRRPPSLIAYSVERIPIASRPLGAGWRHHDGLLLGLLVALSHAARPVLDPARPAQGADAARRRRPLRQAFPRAAARRAKLMALRATILPRRPQLAPTLCRQVLVRDALTRAHEPADAVFLLHREMMGELKRELSFQRGEPECTVARERKLIDQGAAGAHGLFEQASVALRDVEIALAFVSDLIGSGT